jgi:hypothetical protein
VIETVVDLTYRGISLGRGIKLTQIRPTSGYLELAAPMPVGSELALIADDGFTVAATVTWVHEQVAGSDRVPGMIVAPRLAAEGATTWWQARIVLPDDQPRPALPRNRPVTVRPRSHTQPTPGSQGPAQAMPAIIADLGARIAAASGVAPTPVPQVVPAAEPVEPQTTEMTVIEQQPIALHGAAEARDLAMKQTGDHAVIDDGHNTMIMDVIDPASLEADPGSTLPGAGGAVLTAAAVAAAEDASAEEASAADAPTAPEPPAAGGSSKRKKRR